MGNHDAKLATVAARGMLRATGLRSTACRIAVLQFLAEQESPRSHADVAATLVPAGYDKSTIYRCLTEMADANLVARLDLGDHVWRFELKSAARSPIDHPHFMCLDCGKVTCLPDVDVRIAEPAGRKHRPLGDVTEVLLKGHCTQCR